MSHEVHDRASLPDDDDLPTYCKEDCVHHKERKDLSLDVFEVQGRIVVEVDKHLNLYVTLAVMPGGMQAVLIVANRFVEELFLGCTRGEILGECSDALGAPPLLGPPAELVDSGDLI